ncbi:peptidase family C54-domain-containing protein [Boletus edulis BED1]|uniref:Autophagy-related protein 4 n=1 Tax=Boletus edulis BED1 TaxID=1328754 RepID=A0AAD4BIM3_BOLED|nr:peptidase family C54-domain-containing protein [Boletus edulis BED1]
MSRQSRSAPPHLSSPNPPHSSKLPKFLQKQGRDKIKSLTDAAATDNSTSIASSSSSAHASAVSSGVASNHASPRKGGNAVHEDLSTALNTNDGDSEHEDDVDEIPVIVEPLDSPRTRARSDRPLSSISDIRPSAVSMYTSSSSTRISDLPTRLSGWFSHTFSSSSTDLSLPSLLSQSHMSSPKSKTNPLLTAAKHGKGHLDRAMRFLLDSDSTPDKCADPIWLLGVQHPGYEPPPPATPGRRPSVESRRTPSFRSNSSSSATVSELSQSQSPPGKNPAAHWPPVFYADFTSRIWLTYRSQFPPIRDSNLSSLDADLTPAVQAATSSSPRPKKWNWPGTSEKGWTSDAGWGCMLRTGQSLLANALLHLHLGREWRRPPYLVHTNDFATYVQIITWFLDSPLPQAPFSVHRMALAGKDLGKDVGQWFGPSTAAGAIKTLVHAFPEAGLGVAVAADGVVYQSDVYAASNVHIGSPRRHARSSWGAHGVLVLIGIRLGIEGVNPIYYEPIKALYTFPQSVGIAGGRPSSSYYFMGSQADNLFYLDPHHARPTVPLRPAPPSSTHDYPAVRSRENTPDNASDRRAATRAPSSSSHHHRAPTSPSSVRTGSSTFSYHAPLSPSPLQHQLSTASSVSSSSVSSQHPSRWQNASMPASPSTHFNGSDLDPRELGVEEEDLDSVADHYVTQYSAAELRTFHCDRVRKMPLSGLDPSMLLGFLCKDEKDWIDLRRRINELNAKYKTIFTIQDEPPSWPSDSDEFMGLESISDPDDVEDMDSEEDDGVEVIEDEGAEEEQHLHTRDAEDQFFDTRSTSISPVCSSVKGGTKGSEADTEEDPIGPLTPGPNSTFEVDQHEDGTKGLSRNDDFVEIDRHEGEEDDEEWVDPSMPTPLAQSIERPYAPPIAKVKSTGSTGSTGSRKGKRGKKSKKASVPMVNTPSPPMKPEVHFPFPRSLEESFHERSYEAGNYEKRMNHARARDGGRTESGGVKAIYLMGSHPCSDHHHRPMSDTPTYVYKLVAHTSPVPLDPADLPTALPISDIDQSSGFIHLSTAPQIRGTLVHFFTSDPHVFVLRLPYEPLARLPGQIKWESPEGNVCGPRPAEGLFPHLYNGLRLGKDEVESVWKLERGEGGWEVVVERDGPFKAWLARSLLLDSGGVLAMNTILDIALEHTRRRLASPILDPVVKQGTSQDLTHETFPANGSNRFQNIGRLQGDYPEIPGVHLSISSLKTFGDIYSEPAFTQGRPFFDLDSNEALLMKVSDQWVNVADTRMMLSEMPWHHQVPASMDAPWLRGTFSVQCGGTRFCKDVLVQV